MKLISLDILENEINNLRNKVILRQGPNDTDMTRLAELSLFAEIRPIIKAIPTIDPVEIIREEIKEFDRNYKDYESYSENGKGYHTGYKNALQELLQKFNPSSHV